MPGQAGWLPARRHVNRSRSEITHCWIAWGDQGYVSRLASVCDVVPAMSHLRLVQQGLQGDHVFHSLARTG